MTRTITRRLVLGAGAAALGGAALPSPFPDGATLMVGGPGGGAADVWADWLSPGLGRAPPPGTALHKDVVGGADGVTAANVFEARTVPDGSTALLLPGSAAMAWLVGDSRARFDTARWVPALAGVTPGLVVGRLAANHSPPFQAGSDAPVRLAVSNAAGPELPAMLALELLGAAWSPVFGLTEATAMDALMQGQVDAVCLRGRRVPDLVPTLAGAGVQPLFSFGAVDEAGVRQRDPAFTGVPTVTELLAERGPDTPLRRAWFATAAASDLDITMVLPQQTPAAIVALWRRAAAQAAASGAVMALAAAQGVRPLSAPAATASTAAVIADAPAQLALRTWMAKRLDYRAT